MDNECWDRQIIVCNGVSFIKGRPLIQGLGLVLLGCWTWSAVPKLNQVGID